MAEDWTPDIVVGVDFGMTCTGVAYSYGPSWPAPKSIQHWPGLMGSEIATKVPSHLLYCDGSKEWGFQCDKTLADAKDIKQYFKLNLDPQFRDPRPNAPTREDAARYFQDYIYCIYQYTVTYLKKSLPRFEGSKIEFIFSVPTTWKDPRMVAELRSSIQFDTPNHRAVIGLTEAEAAAVYVSGQHYQKNDVILVCDAGGGTTDVNVLKLASLPHEPTVYSPLGYVEGKPIGSVFIDLGVHQLLCKKLEAIRHALPGPIDDIAWQIMVGRFERFKCSFGAEGMELPALKLDLPAAAQESHSPDHGILNGQLDEIQEVFNSKIEDLFGLLDEQIRRLQLSHPAEKISFLVLSGGFGSCPYVKKRLTDRYQSENYLVPEGIRVLTVDEPQLAVVQGQVMNRIQQLKQGATVFDHLYSPVSYGVICDWVYDPKKHNGEPTRYDERNSRTYAVNQIDWLVLQGDRVPRTGVSKEFPRKVYPKDICRPWMAQIVMSTLPLHQLPRSMSQSGARLICELEVDMSNVDKKAKNHRWYHRHPVYFMATIIVKLIIEPVGLQFELWNRAGQKIRTQSQMQSVAQGHPERQSQGPIRIHWESIPEKMQDETDRNRRISSPGGGPISEMGGASWRAELPDNAIIPGK
ncbi:hypothetical protein ARAM_005798 [Aspergillus rambellii]|uniref:Hsp70 family chaperone n=1 Tax=Aspergillus rambellii TaxID=308745 RepID=A0A0F8W9L8_9EURO|nr:hypothetical protein ARAM_005798 [Aspergillus rambellii]